MIYLIAYSIGVVGWFLAGTWWARYERIKAYHVAWESQGKSEMKETLRQREMGKGK